MRFSQGQQIVCNVLWFLLDDEPDAAALTAVAVMLKEWWIAQRQAETSNQVSLNAIEVRGMASQSSPSVEYTVGMPLVGAATQQSFPNNVTVAVKLLTGMGGRSGKGRQFVIGLHTAKLIDPNHLTTAAVNELTLAYNELINTGLFENVRLAVASFFHNGVARATAVVTPCTNATVDSTLDSQRRRLPGRGS